MKSQKPATSKQKDRKGPIGGSDSFPNINEQQILRRIGLKIHRELFAQKKPVEWLAFETGLGRSTLREIIAGRSNLRVLTLCSIVRGLGYKSLSDFLKEL